MCVPSKECSINLIYNSLTKQLKASARVYGFKILCINGFDRIFVLHIFVELLFAWWEISCQFDQIMTTTAVLEQ
jgi:hypothetical protein